MTEAMRIRIVRTPAGEAPLWVRQAWIGLELPLAGRRAYREWSAVGVLSGPKSWWGLLWAGLRGRGERVAGFSVPAGEAVSLLERHHPEAAQWWRDHASHMLGPRGMFVFDEGACGPPESA